MKEVSATTVKVSSLVLSVLGTALAVSPAQADELQTNPEILNTIKLLQKGQSKSNHNNIQNNGLSQITSVSELRDVSPTDWAYEALRSLVERYGCIVGYPDRSFRGNNSLSRWEFAAGLNACLNTMERLIQEGGISKEDIDKLRKLAQEFKSELAALGARVDSLEQRVSFLENHQFSTTTKLNGEVIFLGGSASTSNNQAVFQDRVRLVFATSFTGEDKLNTRFKAGDYSPFLSSAEPNGQNVFIKSPAASTTLAIGGTGNNKGSIDTIAYYAPIKFSKDVVLQTYVAAIGGEWYDYIPTLGPYFQGNDSGRGAISPFTEENPIYRIGGGTGAGATLKLGFLTSVLGPTSFSVGYYGGGGDTSSKTGSPYIPTQGNGIFNGNSTVLAQFTSNIGNIVNVGFTYVNSYLPQGSPTFAKGGNGGSNFGVVGTPIVNTYDSSNGLASKKVVNAYGLEVAVNLAKNITFSGFGTYGSLQFVGNNIPITNGGTGYQGYGEIWTFGGGFAFTDLAKEGSVLGIFGGVQPYYGNVSSTAFTGSSAKVLEIANYTTQMPVQVEVFYKYPVNNNISLTPAVIWISNPTQLINGNSQLIGVLRGTFSF